MIAWFYRFNDSPLKYDWDEVCQKFSLHHIPNHHIIYNTNFKKYVIELTFLNDEDSGVIITCNNKSQTYYQLDRYTLEFITKKALAL